jgi:succinoglycan biosynthesis protein ExoL
MKNIRVLALLPTLGQPRHAKRIAMLKEQGLHVEAVAFKRTLAHGRMPDCAVEIIGTLEHGRYYQRLIELARGARKIANKKYRTFDVLYCFGIDMAIVAIMSKARPDQAVIIETGDIRKPQVAPTLFGKIVRTVDRLALKYTDLLVVTAYDFKIEYYRNTIKTNVKSIVIENKVDFSAISVAPPRTNEPFSIGYF